MEEIVEIQEEISTNIPEETIRMLEQDKNHYLYDEGKSSVFKTLDDNEFKVRKLKHGYKLESNDLPDLAGKYKSKSELANSVRLGKKLE